MTNRQAYNLNKEIEALIDDRGINPNAYTSSEKSMLAQYSGYGGLDQLLEESNPGILYEFYTPTQAVKTMWGLVLRHGFRGGRVLEPAAGVGVFLSQAPAKEYLDKPAIFTAIEPQFYSYSILHILYPQARIEQALFEQLFIDRRINESLKAKVKPTYDLVIGNPPYGSIRGLTGGKYMNMGEKSFTKAQAYDEYFITRGLDLLTPGGLLCYIIGSEVANGGVPFLQRGNTKAKEEISRKSNLIDAYRLPNGVFDRTDVLPDIVLFQKK
jgi:type I restriction-modification system DNA methylase subunit